MSTLTKAWNVAVGSTAAFNEDEFNRDTEVQVKLVSKPSREYIYELLTKIRFPLINVEAIIERRLNIVDFTCKNRDSAEKLVSLLRNHPNVQEARLFESEFVDVKFTGVPHRLPDGKLVSLLNKRNGEVLSTKRLKDRKGYYDGRRIYKMRTTELQQRPLPQFIRVCECSIRVDYHGQPTRCFLCKKYGHVKSECPEAVATPPLLSSDERDDVDKDETCNKKKEVTESINSATSEKCDTPPPQENKNCTVLCKEAPPQAELPTNQQTTKPDFNRAKNELSDEDDSDIMSSSSESSESMSRWIYQSTPFLPLMMKHRNQERRDNTLRTCQPTKNRSQTPRVSPPNVNVAAQSLYPVKRAALQTACVDYFMLDVNAKI